MSRVFQGCFKAVSKGGFSNFQRSFKLVSRGKFLGFSKDVSSQASFKEVSKVFSGNFKDIRLKFEGCFK